MDSTVPFFSVIIPTYNRADTVCKAIDSVLKQTMQDFELLVIDDGSQDNTGKDLEMYRDKIRYYYKENGGGSSARNYAVRRAIGRYISFLDSDDTWLPNRLEEISEYFEKNTEYAAVITDMEVIDEVTGGTIGYTKYKNSWPPHDKLLPYIIENPIGCFSNMTVERKAVLRLGDFDETLKTAEDIDYFLRIAICYKIGLIAKPLLRYRKSANSLSHNIFTGNRLLVMEKFKRNNPEIAEKHKSFINRSIAKTHNSYAEDLLYNRYVKEARRQLIKSIKSRMTVKGLWLYCKSIIIQLMSLIKIIKIKANLMQNRINILFITLSLDVGGLEVLLLELINNLNRTQYNPSVCVLQSGGSLANEFAAKNIPVYCIPKKEGIDYLLPFKIRKLLKNNNINIVHTHNSTPWIYGGIATQLLKGVHLVHTKHSNLNLKQKRLIKTEKWVAKRTDCIIADAKDVRDFMIEKQGISQNRIKLIYNGIDYKKYDCGNKQKINSSPKKIAIIARLVPVKDHETLLLAFKIVNQRMPETELVIVGDGSQRQELIEYCSVLGIGPKVSFLGARRDIPELLKQMCIFVLSSIDEGMSITLLEAMAAELPVVVTKVGGNPEVVVDNETGFLVAPKSPEQMADKIMALLANPQLAQRLGENGRKRVIEKFSIDNMVMEYEKIYNSLH